MAIGAASARAQVVDAEEGFGARIAQERSSRGIPSLEPAADLQVVARRHAQRMADRGEPYHNPDLQSEVQGWSTVAENVGVGPDVESIHQGFMGSDQHRRIILNANLTQVGVGVVRTDDGRLWVVEVFRRPEEAAAAPPTTSPTTTGEALPATRSATPAGAPVAAPPAPGAPALEPTAAVGVPTSGGTPIGERSVRDAAAPVRARLAVAHSDSAVVVPELDELARTVPPEAWAAAFLLAAVVGLQGQVLRRLGLVG